MPSKKSSFFWFVVVLLFVSVPIHAADQPESFELRDSDRVIFLGDTLMEREQQSGWIELMLTTRYPDRNITFRNLGWSADTAAGNSRFGLSLLQAGYEPAEEGWTQLNKQLQDRGICWLRNGQLLRGGSGVAEVQVGI